MITAEIITGSARLEEIRTDWLDLWNQWGQGNPFTHPDWVRPWLSNLGSSIELMVVAAWDGTGLIGLAPLGRNRHLVWRRLVFLGSPEADYPDLIVAGQDPRPVIDCLVRELSTQKWDWLDLEDLAVDSRVGPTLIDCLGRAGFSVTIKPTIPCPALTLEGTWDQLWFGKKRKFRYNLNRSLRLLEENEGSAEFTRLTDRSEIGRFVDQAVGIHAARWAERHTRSVFSQGNGPEFFKQVVPALAEQGLISLDLLTAGGTPISFALSFTSPTRLYYYIAGFNPDYGQYSPGALLLRNMIEQSYDETTELFDFMKGEESYKQHWANRFPNNSHLLAGRPGLWPRLGLLVRSKRSQLRTWARQVGFIRRIYFRVMDAKKKMGNGPDAKADNQR